MIPDHGTYARFKRGCGCEPCRGAKRALEAAYRERRRDPGLHRAYTAGRHLAALLRSGHTLATIAEDSGITEDALRLIQADWKTCRIDADTFEALDGVARLPRPTEVVDEVAIARVLDGVAPLLSLTRTERAEARRLAAAAGWSASEITRRLGASGARAAELVTQEAS